MHVARLRISGVRGFYGNRSLDIELARPDGSLAGWTVLAGRNGSGKSTVLQALGLVLAGPRSTGFIPSLSDWISTRATTAEIVADLSLSHFDSYMPRLTGPRAWMNFERVQSGAADEGQEPPEPEFVGEGLDSLAREHGASSVRSVRPGWFYAGYGPFRHLGGGTKAWSTRRASSSKLAFQVASLFDETMSLADAVDWLIEQRLYELEDRVGASNLIGIVMRLLNDELLPDGFQVSKVTSDGLLISHRGTEFALRNMSDGYRAVTALVVDIVRQMHLAYRGRLELQYDDDVPTLPYPGVILIDEVDAHLHVSWQRKIGTWLKRHFPEIQFIVTTHSPYVCQSADPGGLILLPGPGEDSRPHIIDNDLYERVVYGSGDDAVLSALFGVDTAYSSAGEGLRQRLGELESKILNGTASLEEREEYRSLSGTLSSSLSSRVNEIMSRLEREN